MVRNAHFLNEEDRFIFQGKFQVPFLLTQWDEAAINRLYCVDHRMMTDNIEKRSLLKTLLEGILDGRIPIPGFNRRKRCILCAVGIGELGGECYPDTGYQGWTLEFSDGHYLDIEIGQKKSK